MEERTEDHADVDQEALEDLDVDQDDADRVLGGKKRSADPCEGGE